MAIKWPQSCEVSSFVFIYVPLQCLTHRASTKRRRFLKVLFLNCGQDDLSALPAAMESVREKNGENLFESL